MLYLTFGDAPSGVLSSQAIDVVKYMRTLQQERIRFLAFISPRSFKKNKLKIRQELPDADVLPMFPKIDTWCWNWITLALYCLFTGERHVVTRNVLAANLALKVKSLGLIKSICLDGRGAIAAEWHEYKVVPSEKLKRDIQELEHKAVTQSDFRIAVSEELINYWRNEYQYNSNSHVVIPCTLGLGFKNESLPADNKKYGIDENDIVLIYSGSTAGWQSFKLLEEFLVPLLNSSKSVKVIFMTGKDERVDGLIKQYPQQVQRQWVQHAEVQAILACGDYGIMIREQTVTNKVASPTKFAEYLSAGLQVLISDGLGDYTQFVKEHECGKVINTTDMITLAKTSPEQKAKNLQLVHQYFTKASQKNNYLKVLNAMH